MERWIALALVLMGLGILPSKGLVFYVDPTAVGTADGSSWTDAFTSLSSALLSPTVAGDEFWVVQGTHKPDVPGGARAAAFLVPKGCAIYGGFTNGMSTLAERNPARFPTILSGDLDGNDTVNFGNRSDNSFHVITTPNITTYTCLIDGFTIRGGNADNTGVFPDDVGGGILMNSSAGFTVLNCIFVDNSGDGAGAIYMRRATGNIEDCVFVGNRATSTDTGYGGGALGFASQMPTLVNVRNCYFAGNTSAIYGGAAFPSPGGTIVVNFYNCLMAGNTAASGGALYLRNGTNELWNCTLAGNSPEAFVVAATTNLYINNSIVWTNDVVGGNEYDTSGAGTFKPTYSDISGGAFTTTNGNIRANPVWGTGVTGLTWSAVSVFSPATGKTRLTRASATWTVNQFAGKTVNPNVSQKRQFLISSNSATELYVWGDAQAIGTSGASFRIWDYQLAQGSPCIDTGTSAGAPTNDIVQTLRPRGNGTDMGAYESSATGTVAGVIYVKANATGGNNGQDWVNAYTSLTQALAVAVADVSQIWVAAGTYKPGTSRTASFTLAHRVPVYGGFAGTESSTAQRNIAANPTILSGDISGNDTGNFGNRGDNAYHVVLTAANLSKNIRLDGFIIRGGAADLGTAFDASGEGGGMFTETPDGLTIANCVFADNTALGGGGLYIKRPQAGGMRIEDCVFSGNRATEAAANNRGGGAISGQGNTGLTTLERVVFTGNRAATSVGGALAYAPTEPLQVKLVNALVAGNQSGYNDGGGAQGGGLMLRATNAALVNCTLAYNDPYGITSKDMTPTLLNSILWDNTTSELLVLNQAVTASFSDIDETGYDGFNGNIRLNPAFDAGTNRNSSALSYAPATGLSTLTAAGANWVPGAYAGMAVNPNTAQSLQFWILTNSTTTLTLWGDATAVAALGNPFRVYNYHLTSGSPCVNGGSNLGAPTLDLEKAGRPVDGDADMGVYEFGGSTLFTNGVVYVDKDAVGANNGTSWADAFTTVQAALSIVPSGKAIWVAEGTYKPGATTNDSFTLRGNVAVYGGFAGNETVLSARDPALHLTILSGDIAGNDASDDLTTAPHVNRADNARHVVVGVDNATLDGFLIVGGYAYNPDAGANLNSWGGGILMNGTSPTIRNCKFVDNYGRNGGAMAMAGNAAPVIDRCTFGGNWAEVGGAAWSSGSPTFDRCIFVGSSSTDKGAAAYFEGAKQPVVQNGLVVGNTGVFDGAFRVDGVAGSNAVRLVNCTIARNSGTFTGTLFVKRTCQPQIYNSILWRNEATDAGGADEISIDTTPPLGSVVVRYSDVTGGYPGTGNINTNPLFITQFTGTWTTVSAFNPALRQTTLTRAAAGWQANQLAGFVVNPNTNQFRHFVVISNTSTSLVVWGNAALAVSSGNVYSIQDYDILGASMCVDRGTSVGAPNRDIEGRPRPGGGGFDMGAYEVQSLTGLGLQLNIY
ncbi:MAG: right-handed parallel beta-helix repeat-containing protein [Lentisphaerae bacterium]|nr:right-handed parallel beta-helix repeat-containing protein [Lentisphaerota bacterium]